MTTTETTETAETTTISGASLLDAVKDIVPTLRKNGVDAEDRRWLPQENIDLLDEAGVFRMAVPRRFGGLDLPLTDQFEVLREIARGCGSTGWVAVAWVSTAWMISLYPDRAQEEVFQGGSVRVSGGFTPTGTLRPAEGGYLLDGSWRFNSGCQGADWDLLATLLEHPDREPELLMAIVPMSQLSVADDWHASAAIGTGSATVTANDLLVPTHHVVDGEAALRGTTGDRSNVGATGRNYGLISFVMAESVAVYIGMAQGAYDSFVERLPGRGIAYSSWTEQIKHPLTQITVSQAANKISAARALAAGIVELMQERADVGEQLTIEEKATVRGQCGYALQLAKEAVEALYSIVGASAIMRDVPFQRYCRDLEALARHGMMTPNINFEVHGRVLLGLDPDTELL